MASQRLRGGEFLLRTTTLFFDREEEAAWLAETLSAPRARLVTLTGPGGTGKTRLAVEAAAQVVELARDGAPREAVVVALAEVAEAGRLYDHILRALGVLPVAGCEPLDQLATVLGAHPGMLLILDNFEQLVEEGAGLVRALLARAAVKLLVTSRHRLRIEGEREFRLAPLPVPVEGRGLMVDGNSPPSTINPQLSTINQIPSVQLFVDRAQAARPDFQLTERNAAVVAQLCVRLEGIPLAIELAAARVGLLAPARILEQVNADRLDFLVSGRRDTAARQRTLRATLDWSYQLLPAAGRRFLAELSVFRGGWTLEAAQAVCRLSEKESLGLLMLLRDSSLIGVVDADEGLRFTMLDTVQEYAAQQLTDGESGRVRKQHQDYFLALAEEAEPQLTGPEQGAWLDRLQAEHENLRAALSWSGRAEPDPPSGHPTPNAQHPRPNAQRPTPSFCLRMAAALWRFWWVRGHWRAAGVYLSEALEREAPGPGGVRTGTRARALYGAGVLAHDQGDFRLAEARHQEALAIYRELGDRGGIASVLHGLGRVAEETGDYRAAQAHHLESLAIQRELGNGPATAACLRHLGDLAVRQGDHAAARAWLEESLALERALGDSRGIARSLGKLGFVAKEQGRHQEARSLYEQSLALHQELGDRAGMALACHFLGVVAEHEGDLGLARRIYEECLATFRELGDQSQVAWTLHGLGFLAYRQEDFAAARSLLGESLVAFRGMEHRIGIARTIERLGGLAAAEGEMERAGRLLAAAAALRAAIGAQPALAEQQEFDRDVAAVRKALDEEAFAAAWTEGQAMKWEHAAQFALGKVDPEG